MTPAARPPDPALDGATGRHQYLLIRRLGTLLRSRMSAQGHLLQAVHQEHRGNCLPPSKPCSPACQEAQALVALTGPYMPVTRPRRPVKPLRLVTLKKPRRRPARRQQAGLFDSEVAG